MKIQFINIGRPHNEALKKSIEDFTKRINNYFSTEWIILSPIKNAASLPTNVLKENEGAALLSKINKNDFIVLLDETGKQLSSTEFANFIEQKSIINKNLCFITGGAFGVSNAVKQRADFVLSLSRLVFPHMIVRLIVAEQVYRACTILRNEKYHHS